LVLTHSIPRMIVSEKKRNESSVIIECTVTIPCLFGQLLLTEKYHHMSAKCK